MTSMCQLLAKVRSGQRVSVDNWKSDKLHGFNNDDMLMVDIPVSKPDIWSKSDYFHSVDGLPQPPGWDDPLYDQINRRRLLGESGPIIGYEFAPKKTIDA